MKQIGILYDSESKKIFLLPEQVKTLTSKGIGVNVLSGIGKALNISDASYMSAGAKIFEQYSSLISASDIILKTNAFGTKELEKMEKKIAITMVNFLTNVDMLFAMLQNNVTGLEWCSLATRSGYVFFPELEELKAPIIMKTIQDAISSGLGKPKDRLVLHGKPNLLILNATFAGVALAKLALDENYNVTIADNDIKYCRELKSSGLTKLNIVDANYDTLEQQIRENHVFVNTCINPTDRTKTRITKQMAQIMPKGSMLIDAACENGYGFHFIKKLADKTIKWNKVEKSFYLAVANITDLVSLDASQIISRNSVDHLIDIVQNGTNSPSIYKIVCCEKGEVVNSNINKKLNLY